MKNYEAIVLLMAPLGTALAAFDYASAWDRPAAGVQRAAAPTTQPCPEAHHERDAAGACVPVIAPPERAGLAAR